MVSGDRRRTSIDPRRGLYAGAALIGLGMSLAVGQGVATATPSDPSGTSQAAETSDSHKTADTSDAPDTSPDAPSNGSRTDLNEADADEADLEVTDIEAGTDRAEAAEAAVTEEADSNADVTDSEVADADVTHADVADADSVRPRTDGATSRESSQSSTPVTLDAESAADAPVGAVSRSAVEERAKDIATAVEPDDVTSVVAVPALAKMDLAAPAVAPSTPTLRSLVSARPVTVSSMVTDVLTWVGLRPLANGLPAPMVPVSALVQSFWLAVRQTQYTLNNQRPTAAATMSGPGPDGVVTGSLNAVDYDDTALAYAVTAAPERGSVSIDALGNFTYTPDTAGSPRGDRFTVTIDDTVGNPFHIHGLLGLLGITGPTRVTIVVAAPLPAHQNDRATIDLTELRSRDGVAVTANSNGAVSVIDGRFTDDVVTTAADAAAVMNALAPALGAVAGFADPAAITVARAGVGSSVESYYRLSETISGIKVLGSDVILVTDADGMVTGLFNNYRGLAAGFDVTPAATVDEDSEVRSIAASAYLGATDPEAVESILASSTFTNQLIIYAIDDDAAPSLAWRVVVKLPDTGDMSPAGATYLIDADGVNAGDIIVTISNVQDAAVVTSANDWRGDERTITVDSSRFLFFTSTKMFDPTRKVTTYKTSFPFFGLAGPSLPGSVVRRSWFSWDRGAVSAHANTAVVYDYYQDVLGRTSFDGAGAPIVVSIRYNPGLPIFGGYTNAFWDPDLQQFGFGDSGYLQAALDVVGHEFTHAVVSYVVGDGGSVLDYGESGALNEAYADILGVLIEGKSGQDRWLVGEDSDNGVLRNLANPASIVSPQGAYRTHYATRYTGSGDDGGEHVNSTIFSHAAYKMMTATATSGISDESWSRVFYQSLYRLSPGAEFIDGRAAVLSAAAALGFTSAQLDAIHDAFDSVGIVDAAASSIIAA